jgi:transcriptional regulator with XRE-family HTH domain
MAKRTPAVTAPDAMADIADALRRAAADRPDPAKRKMTTLAELVDSRRRALGKTYRKVAEESGLSLAFIHKVASGQLASFPTPRTIEGLATALELPEQTVIDAAGSDIGVKVQAFEAKGEYVGRAIYYGQQVLDDDEREMVLAIITKFALAHGKSIVVPDE